MERVNLILNHEKYKEYFEKNLICEKDRIFCKHNMEHFLDMARICYIMCLEQNIKVDKEIVYSVALLHDIGRWMEYELGVSHEKASFVLSKSILVDCNFSDDEIEIILDGIFNHRNKNATGLNLIFYHGDKLSRSCFSCVAESECKWATSKKNLEIKY